MKSYKVYDCFCYFNEDMLLKIRLETLWDSVDFFIISEASYSHKGDDRTLQFDLSKFSKYKEKIRYIPLHRRPEGENNFWKNENFIRNNLSKGLFDAQPQDRIIISDLDEIPEPSSISTYLPHYFRGDFQQKYYGYFFNNYWLGDIDKKGNIKPNSNTWLGSKITSYKYFVTFYNTNATSVRSYKSSGLTRAIKRKWFLHFNVQKINNGGWHFTWIFPINDIIKKIENTAHQEFNTTKFKKPSHIKEMILNGKDFHKPNSRYQAQKLDHTFPQYLIENRQKFKEFLLPL